MTLSDNAAPFQLRRHGTEPILTASDWPESVNAVFNPAAAVVDGQTVLLARVEDRRGHSSLWVARSDDGINSWAVDAAPLLTPDDDAPWGYEDARLTFLDELGCHAITCTAYGPDGPAVFLATTKDFAELDRVGVIVPPEDKNAAVLPRRIDGDWCLLHRPVTAHGNTADIWISRSSDLHSWRAPTRVMCCRPGGWWDAARIGIGPPPLETDEGWLLIYHGVRLTTAGSLYRLGLALLDLENPQRVLRRCSEWILSPSTEWERTGDVPNVVFACGAVLDPSSQEIRVYYGAADTCIGLATAPLACMLDALRASPPDDAKR